MMVATMVEGGVKCDVWRKKDREVVARWWFNGVNGRERLRMVEEKEKIIKQKSG